MITERKQELKSALRTSLISAAITAIFMYLIYYPGWQSIAAGLCIGFFIPLTLSIYTDRIVRQHLRKVNLLILLALNTLVHLMVILLASVVFVVLFYMNANFTALIENPWFLYSRYFVIGVGFGLALSLIFNFFTILDTLIGHNVLGKLFIGMYRNPVEVDRVFMFLDIKSSTTIAEQIGHMKFLSLVNDFFFDLAEPVRNTKGEIYKYVGDEAIITWKSSKALKNANCVRCYLQMRSVIRSKAGYYKKKYGVVPDFKAGLHGGMAVTGELGYNRREIAFMGDVLNTTARIEEACKTFDKALLISGELADRLEPINGFIFSKVGKVQLRGKAAEMELYSLENREKEDQGISPI